MADDIQKFGGWFTLLGWIMALAVLTMLLQKYFFAEPDITRTLDQQGVEQLELYRDLGGHYQITGKINGHSADFLLDSGATIVSIPSDLAASIGLKRGPAFQVGTANGTITNYSTRISRLEFGGFVLNNVRASINPGMSGSQVLLGMNVLSRFEMIQRDNRLTLKLP